MSALRLAAVRKDFGGTPVLRGIDLTVPDGELLAVLGPSGSGKSTLLRVIAGLVPVTAGRVWLGDADVTDTPPGKRDVSMDFQSYALFPHLTVRENIGFGLAVRDVPRGVAQERTAWAAALVGCDGLLDRRPAQLSGGERQRVALARAIVREPAAFLLDEPLSNLDAELRVAMRAELRALHRRVGATMLYVTHDQAEALTLGDRVAVLAGGVLRQIGTPEELWRAPADRFVARFIGSPAMNLLPADGSLPVTGLPLGRELELGVRPDALLLEPALDVDQSAGRLAGGAGVAAQVVLVERLGADAHVHLQAGAHEIVARVPAAAAPALGATLTVNVRREDVLLFDARTGDRVPWT